MLLYNILYNILQFEFWGACLVAGSRVCRQVFTGVLTPLARCHNRSVFTPELRDLRAQLYEGQNPGLK